MFAEDGQKKKICFSENRKSGNNACIEAKSILFLNAGMRNPETITKRYFAAFGFA